MKSNQTLILSYRDLRKRVGHVMFERGQKVLQDGLVHDAILMPLGRKKWVIESTVLGSNEDAYEQSITISQPLTEDHRLLQLDAVCSCPVGFNCKHAVAVLLSLSTDADEGPLLKSLSGTQSQQRHDPAADSWLLSLSASKADTHEKESVQDVIYLLETTVNPVQPRLLQKMGVLAQASKPRVDKSGWTKPARLSYDAERTIARGANAIQNLEIYALIRALSAQSYGSGLAKIEGTAGQILLQNALATQRLFLASEAKSKPEFPMQSAPVADLVWQWDEVAAGQGSGKSGGSAAWQLNWQLQIQDQGQTPGTLGQHVLLFPSPQAVYVDLQQRLIGLVNMNLVKPEQLMALCHAPPMSVATIEAQEGRLMDVLGASGLPLPPVMAQNKKVEGRNPSAHLRLSLIPVIERRLRGLVQAQLTWSYPAPERGANEEALPLSFLADTYAKEQPQIFVSHAQGKLLLTRDGQAEMDWMFKLRAFGLTRESTGLWVQAQQAPASLWLDAYANEFAALTQTGFALTVDEPVRQMVAQGGTVQIALQNEARPSGAGGSTIDTNPNLASNAWFDLSLGVEIDGVRQDIMPWLSSILANLQPKDPLLEVKAQTQNLSPKDSPDSEPNYIFVPHPASVERFLRLDIRPLRPWLGALLELVSDRPKDFEKGGALRMSRMEALRVSASLDTTDLGSGVVWDALGDIKALLAQLKGQSALPSVPVPEGLQAQLRPYQQGGLDWLQFLRAHSLAGVLADDMGLGKTLQTLAHILVEKQSGRLKYPALVVAPVSLMGNWAREAKRFTPKLSVLVFHGTERHEHADKLTGHDVVLTSYSLLLRERELWLANPWHLLVLDEAQNIKNANTHAAHLVGELNAAHRLCLSGTPMENHLGELWSLFHFLMPGFLGSQAKFAKLFRTPIEKHGDGERMAQLRRRVTPFMLRRNKSEVAGELPPKVETISSVKLSGKQADLYETIRLTTVKKVREALAVNGLAKSQITILDALLKLRQVCCDPRLVPLAKAKAITQSAKLEQLMEMIPEMLQEGRKILLFSQFTSMLDLIELELKKRGIPWIKLTGQSTHRDTLIERFTSGEVPLFLISLKAGGVGLNLPQADTVIHYDPWWNPAVENQATDRAHRIGQTQTVFVYKMVAEGTIEERILALQARKAELAKSMYSDSVQRKQPLFTEGDVMDLLKPLD